MKELLKTGFSKGGFPSDWTMYRANHAFKDGILLSGSETRGGFTLPGKGWNHLRIDVLAKAGKGFLIGCGDGKVKAYADIARSQFWVHYASSCELARKSFEIPPKAGPSLISFDFNRGRIVISVDNREILSVSEPSFVPFSGNVDVEFWDDCKIYEVSIRGGDEDKKYGVGITRKPKDDFFLDVNVDFPTDLAQAPFTREMFDQFFAELKSWGVSRCHWIYYGGKNCGMWDHSLWGQPQIHENAIKTFENVGEIFPAVVQAAHKQGIKMYGVLKPFDFMGHKFSVGESDPEAKTNGKLERVGGPVIWMADFVAKHRELCMSRKPSAFGAAGGGSFTRIDIVKEDAKAIPFGVKDLKLYVSNDNTTYREYAGVVERDEVIEDYPVWEHTSSGGRMTKEKRRSRVLRLKNLNIEEKYFVVKVEGQARSFANTLIDLIHVFGEKGEERLLTYGVQSRFYYAFSEKDGGFPRIGMDFREKGVEFDQLPGVPTAVMPGYDAISARFVFDGKEGMLAVARGKDRDVLAGLSPSFPETHEWWLSMVRELLEAGCDGVEMRVRNHHAHLVWAEYGFEKPVREEFLKRYGVDLWATDDFDKDAWRKLRGEGYTEFYRKAKKLTHSYGKPLGLHISPTFLDPGLGAGMQIHWDWKTWLKEGLADSIMLKEVWPFTRLEMEILDCIKGKEIETIFCPHADKYVGPPRGEQVVKGFIDLARKAGHSGYQFYESFALIKASPGRITMPHPAFKEVFRKEFVS